MWEDLSRLVAPQGNFAVYRQMLKTAAYAHRTMAPNTATLALTPLHRFCLSLTRSLSLLVGLSA